ncbi:MAG: alcohol dehydrogenase [Metallosphaera sp.]
MKSIVFNQGIIIADVPEIPVGRDMVEITPEKVLLDGIENGIYLGLLWVKPNLILGGVGIGKVRDVGVEVDQSLIGKRVLVMPYSRSRGGIGTEIDGVLAETSVIPQDCTIPLPEDDKETSLLLPYISLTLDIMDMIKGGESLLIGQGLIGNLLMKLAATNIDPIPDDMLTVNRKEIQSKKWDYIIISSMRGWARHVAGKLVKGDGKIIIPKFLNSWPPYLPHNSILIPPRVRSDSFDVVKRLDGTLKNLIGKSDNAIASVPTVKPGIIVDVRKSLGL